MTSTHWGHETLPNLEFWDELNAILAQWICQARARTEATPGNHNDNPAMPDWSCDWCFGEAVDIVGAALRHLLQTYGSRAYACGREGVPEGEAARRALEAVIVQF